MAFAKNRLRGLCASAVKAGFTLVEMLVALAILAVMMAAIGEIFSLAGHATRLGQATLKVMANVRAVQAQLAKDLGNLDTGGYLIIRQSYYAPPWDAGWPASGASDPSLHYQPGDVVMAYSQTYPLTYGTPTFYYCVKANTAYYTGATATNAPGSGTAAALQDWRTYTYDTAPGALWNAATGTIPAGETVVWRDDQIGFLANGNFQSRTGNSTGSLVDYVTSSSAAVWYGQLTVSYGSGVGTPGGIGSPLAIEKPYWQQSNPVPPGQPPSGENAGDFYLGRRVLLLVPSVPPALGAYATYSNTTFGTPASGAVAGESPADITSSRLDIATITPAAIEAAIAATAQPPSAVIPDAYCYRFASVITPAASEVAAGTPTQLINGYFRMTPIVLPGVPSFSVDVGYLNATGQLQWYGPDATPLTTNPNPSLYLGWSPALISVPGDEGGYQSLVFTQANRQYWPTALKITYVVTDPQNRMEGGQVITQIISLPQ